MPYPIAPIPRPVEIADPFDLGRWATSPAAIASLTSTDGSTDPYPYLHAMDRLSDYSGSNFFLPQMQFRRHNSASNCDLP